jgi:hypothetical protein
MPERESHGSNSLRQIVPPIHGDHPRRVRECRDLREQLGRDVLAGDEQLDRLEIAGCVDEVLPLDCEQPELVAPAPVVELADELEPLVVAGGDQA